MYAKLAVLFLAAAAIAAPTDAPAGGSSTTTTTTNINKCNVGTLQCCNNLAKAGSKKADSLAGLLTVGLGDITGQLGFNCSPITVIGALASGGKCNANPVCCKGVSQNGLFQVGCTSSNINV